MDKLEPKKHSDSDVMLSLPRDYEPHTYVAGIVTLAVAVAILPMPYGYYTLLHLVLCAACVYYLLTMQHVIGPGLKVILGAAAVLYNPIAPLYLREKILWTGVNLATLAVMYTSVFKLRKDARAKKGNPS